MQMVGCNGGNQFRQYVGQNVGNLNGYNDVQNVENHVIQNAVQNLRIQNVGNQNGLIGVPGNANQNPNRNGIQLQAEEFDLMTAAADLDEIEKFNANCILMANLQQASTSEEYDLMVAAADLDKIEEVNANCILMANLQQASSSGTQTDSTPVYDSDGSAEVHENYDNNEIFNMFTQEEQYTELLEPIPESHQVPQNDNDVISEVTRMEQGEKIVEQHPVNFEETRALYESLYQNLAVEVEKVNSQASTSGTQTDIAPVYDTDGSAEVHENCDDNEIFNMFTHEEQYTELLEPIPESHQVPQNDNDVISEDTS
nr:hypothetical protein [Tanacetum cinerariifolium]